MTAEYNQISLQEKDISKTAFVSRHGLFECCTARDRTALFGLTNMRLLHFSMLWDLPYVDFLGLVVLFTSTV